MPPCCSILHSETLVITLYTKFFYNTNTYPSINQYANKKAIHSKQIRCGEAHEQTLYANPE